MGDVLVSEGTIQASLQESHGHDTVILDQRYLQVILQPLAEALVAGMILTVFTPPPRPARSSSGREDGDSPG